MKILVVDDELNNREGMRDLLKKLGHEVDTAENGAIAFDLCLKRAYDFIISDVRMPIMDGIQFFQSLQAHQKIPFAFMTAYGRLEDAVDVLRQGALHFLSKPVRKKQLEQLLSEVEKLKKYKNFNLTISDENFIYVSSKMKMIDETIITVANTQVPVMIVGESGTGKEIVARRIHELSLRRQAPFVAVNLSSIPLSLCESELFGYEKGAFTGADRSKQGLLTSANGGTLFLDELSSMPIELQPKLLRAIESKNIMPLGSTKSFEIDVRFISALNISPYQLIKQNKLREDLFYRLSVVVIDLPPLRERTEDIPVLINYFVAKFSKQNEKENLVVSQDFIDACLNYAWPGNIRELKNVVERAVVLSTSNELTKKDLPEHIANQNSNTDHEIRIRLGMTLEAIESKVIEETLKNCGGDKNKAAQILGINPRTIHRWQSKNFSF